MDKNQQELFFKLNMFEQQIQNLHQQLQAVERAILDIGTLKIDLEDIKNSKGKEIMASIGKGIFVKANILSNDLIVDVGGRNFVTKSASETQEIMAKQIEKLEGIKVELNNAMEEINNQLTETMSGFQGN